MALVPVKVRCQQTIRAEIIERARAPPELECPLPGPHSVCDTSVVCVQERASNMLKQIR